MLSHKEIDEMSILPKIQATGPIHIHHLFVQPTYWCKLNCKGCYVKGHEKAQDPDVYIGLSDWQYLFDEIWLGALYVNQISVSLDPLPTLQFARDYMRNHFSMITNTAFRNRNNTLARGPELHVTAFDISTWYDYANSVLPTNVLQVDLLSISNIKVEDIPALKKLRKEGCQTLNFNHLVPWGVTSRNIDKHVEKLNLIGKYVDIIHLVINKPIMDKEPPRLVQMGRVSRMRTDVAYIGTLMKRLDPEVRQKLHVDRCLQDVHKFQQDGHGCSANISKFTIWPDGSVSGCPYAGNGITKSSGSPHGIVANIREAAKQYEFRDRCHLPAIYNHISR